MILLVKKIKGFIKKDPILSENPKSCSKWCGMSAIVSTSSMPGKPAIVNIINCHGCVTTKKLMAVSIEPGEPLVKNSFVFLVESKDDVWMVVRRPY